MNKVGEYWDPKIETMEVERLREIQWHRLKRLISYAYNFSSFYRNLFDKAGMKPEDIRSLEDVSKMPIWGKDDARKLMEKTGDPFGGLLTQPLDKSEFVYSSAGTTGRPTYSPRSRSEYQLFSEIFARHHWMVGVRPAEVFIYGTMQFHGAQTAFTIAGSKIGATICGFTPPHPLLAPKMLNMIRSLKPSVTINTPDILPAIGEEAIKQGIDPKDVFPPGANVVMVGEVVTPGMKKEMAERFGVNIYDLGALSELWFIHGDCWAHKGNHVFMDGNRVEGVDPDTGKPIGPGKPAEIIITNLLLEGAPVIRFGSEDMGILMEEKCDCGRTHPRIRWIGRSGWRVKVSGKTIAPIVVQEIFERFPETREANLTLLKEKNVPDMEKLRIRAAYNERITTDPEGLKNRLKNEIKQELSVEAEITWIKFEELPIYIHKIQRVIEV